MSVTRSARLLFSTVLFLVTAVASATPALTHAAVRSTTRSSHRTTTRAVATTGCGRAWTPGSTADGTLSIGGVQRTYLLHVPKGYTPTTPLPLVLNLPGTGMNALDEQVLSRMSAAAGADGFIVVYPNGSGSPLGWDVYAPNSPLWATGAYKNADDVAYLTALVSSLEGQLCVDSSRIDVTGMSLGAVMAYHLACSNTPWLAAIAPVAGLMPQSQGSCALAHPTPLLAFNGQSDPLVPYNGIGLISPIPQSVGYWARANGCPSVGQTGFSQGDVVETVYSHCPNGADTQLYTITDGGHTCPGGTPLPWLGATTTVINATALMYAFFMAHPLTKY